MGAGKHLGQTERLGHVVVATGAPGGVLVLDRPVRRQGEDRDTRSPLTRAPADLDPVDVGQHPVEHDQVGVEPERSIERLPAASGLLDLESVVAERGCHRVDDRGLVIDDEDAATRALC